MKTHKQNGHVFELMQDNELYCGFIFHDYAYEARITMDSKQSKDINEVKQWLNERIKLYSKF